MFSTFKTCFEHAYNESYIECESVLIILCMNLILTCDILGVLLEWFNKTIKGYELIVSNEIKG